MSFSDWSNKKKKKEQEQKYGSFSAWSNAKHGITTDDSDDIAPVRDTSGYFQKSAHFDDGYQRWDVAKTAGATLGDVGENAVKGGANWLEKIWDGMLTLGTVMNRSNMVDAANSEIMLNSISGNKESAQAILDRYTKMQENAEKATAEYVAKDIIKEEKIDFGVDEYSVLGEKSDALVQSGSELVLREAVKAIPVVGAPLAYASTGFSVLGGEAENAFRQDATYDEALSSGVISAAGEMGTEHIFGGLKIGKNTLSDGLVKKLTSTIPSKVIATLAKWGFNTVGEGFEEDLSGWISAAGQKLTYLKEKEINEIYTSEDRWDNFLGGVILGGLFEGVSIPIASKKGIDYVTGLGENEKKVIDKVYNDAVTEKEKSKGKKLTTSEKTKIFDEVVERAEKGDISIDTIEEVLGGKTYEEYKTLAEKEGVLNSRKKEIEQEISSLVKTPEAQFTIEQREQLTSLREEVKGIEGKIKALDTNSVKKRLSEEVFEIAKNSRLGESYAERARRGQKFTADLTQYTGKQREAVQRAIDSGVLNNTNRSHELVNILSKIEADKGIAFDYTDNAKLKESGFAIEGKVVNGFVKDGGVTLNVQSSKAWQSTVGHEITHVLEGSEAYSALRETLYAYAESKGELASRKAALTELYNGMNADIDAELTADLVGDYLFTDKDFINKLTGNRTLFQKVWDEVKYLCKVATGKELTEIEKVERKFAKAWKEQGKIAQSEDSGKAQYPVKYSLSANAKTELHNALYNTSYRDEVRLRDVTPEIMLSQKGVRNLPMAMNASHIRENVFSEKEAKKLGLRVDEHTHYHGLGETFFLQIIDGLDNVTEAYRGTKNAENSSRRENYFLLVSKFKDKNGNTINVPVYIDEHANYNRVMVDVNKISTVFGRDGFRDYINRQVRDKNLVRIKNKSTQTSERNALIAKGYGIDALDTIISQNSKKSIGNQKNSLSYTGEAPPIRGNFATPMSDIRYTAPTAEAAENIAPLPASPATEAATTAQTPSTPPSSTPPSAPTVPKASGQPTKVAEVLTKEPKKNTSRSLLTWIEEELLDNGMVFEKLAKKTGNRELEARWNSIRNAGSMAQYFIKNGAEGVKSINDVRKTVESRGEGYLKAFSDYMYHMHNIDRMSLESRARAKAEQMLRENPEISELVDENMELVGTTKDTALLEKAEEYIRLMQVTNKAVFGDEVTADDSYARVQELIRTNPEFKQYAEEIYANNRYLRELMVEEGVISQETADLWEEMYPHYVPIRRDGNTGAAVNVPLDTRRTGINAPVKRATGGNRDILPLFETLGTRAVQTYNAIAKNRFGLELMNALGGTVEADKATLDDAIASLEQSDSLLKAGENGMSPTFTVFENGERVTYEITEEMYDALKPREDKIGKTIGGKALNAASAVYRGLITQYNLLFSVTNPIKDVQDVLINSQHAAKTYAAIPRAIKEIATKGEYHTEYLKYGGDSNTLFDNEKVEFEPNKALEIAKTALGLNAISKANEVIEMIPRLAEYIASREAGRSIDVSMLDAARVTTNFGAGGRLTKKLNRYGATFLSASVNGAVQQARNLVEAKQSGVKGVIGLAAKFLVAGLGANLLNDLAWGDDEEYEELSDYVKQNYYIVGKYGDGKFVRIPKGRTVAVIQNAFEQMEHLITGDDEADLRTFLDLAAENILPNNPLEDNIFAPIMDVVRNEAWYGGELVPQRLQDLPAAEQYDESTDSFSRWFGEAFDVSPYKVNYLLDQYTGGLGDVVLPMLTPEAESGDDSVVGKLTAPFRSKFTTDSVMNNQNVSDFYDKKDELTVNAKGRGATDDDILSSRYMNSLNSEIGKLYGEKREIQSRDDLSDSEKYEKVRAIQSRIVELTKEALDAYDDISYDGDYANIGNRYFKRGKNGEWDTLSGDQVTKYKVTSAAGDAPYATDGNVHYRYYVKEGATEGTWEKISDKEFEKQEKVTSGLGITPEEYWGNKAEYDDAFENPGKYAVAKSVGGYEAYKGYIDDLNDLKADKDANGNTISGSAKAKKTEYISNLDIEYGQKIILYRSLYDSKADRAAYDDDIVEYLINHEGYSYDDKVAIFKALGFTVSDNGTVTW